MKKKLLLLVLFCVGLAACESTEAPDNGNPAVTKGERLFILSQGAYPAGEARLDLWNIKKDTFYTNLVSPFGKAGNDLQYINNKVYAVLDNSSKIEVINPDSTAYHTSISFGPGSTPYKILQVSSTEAWVPDIYGKPISIIDLATNTNSASKVDIDSQYSLVLYNKLVYSVGAPGEISAIDPASKTVITSHWLNYNAGQVVVDSVNSTLIVLTNGNYTTTSPKLYFVNPSTLIPTDSITIDNGFVNSIVMANDRLLLLYGDNVKSLDLKTHALTTDALFTKGYYSGYYDASNSYLILGTGIDFQHDDSVDIFDMEQNKLIKTFPVGVGAAAYLIIK